MNYASIEIYRKDFGYDTYEAKRGRVFPIVMSFMQKRDNALLNICAAMHS